MAAHSGNLGGDRQRSVGRQPQEFGGSPWIDRREMAFEEGLEEGGALLLGGESLCGSFFSVAVSQLLAAPGPGTEGPVPPMGSGYKTQRTLEPVAQFLWPVRRFSGK